MSGDASKLFYNIEENQLEAMAAIIRNKKPEEKADKEPRPNHEFLLNEEEKLFKILGIKYDLTGLKIPKKEDNKYRPLITPKGMTLTEIIKLNKTNCPIKIDPAINLDNLEIKGAGDLHKTTAVWVVDSSEPDLRGSFSSLKRTSIMSLSQRLIFGLEYFLETGNHPDHERHTITQSYVVLKGNKTLAFSVFLKFGAAYVSLVNDNMISGGRQVFE